MRLQDAVAGGLLRDDSRRFLVKVLAASINLLCASIAIIAIATPSHA